jgi:hypothetical protein
MIFDCDIETLGYDCFGETRKLYFKQIDESKCEQVDDLLFVICGAVNYLNTDWIKNIIHYEDRCRFGCEHEQYIESCKYRINMFINNYIMDTDFINRLTESEIENIHDEFGIFSLCCSNRIDDENIGCCNEYIIRDFILWYLK